MMPMLLTTRQSLLLLLLVGGVLAKPCKDFHQSKCLSWFQEGACESNQKFMHEHCKKSCGLCDNAAHDSVAEIVEEGEQGEEEGESDGEEDDVEEDGEDEEEERQREEPPSKTTSTAALPCADDDDKCPDFEEDCLINAHSVIQKCRKTCQVCHLSNDELEALLHAAALGIPQLMGPNEARGIGEVMREAEETFDDMVESAGSLEDYMREHGSCRNRDANCAYWAAKGYCGSTKFMKENCGPVCGFC